MARAFGMLTMLSSTTEGVSVATSLSPFVARHIGPREADIAVMLQRVAKASLAELADTAIPASIRSNAPLAIEAADSEAAVLEQLRGYAAANKVITSMLGQGYYGTITPGVIGRNVLENPAWYTAYTPYQPEISQGRLEALVNFQTMVTDLTGLDIAGSSLLDEATAAAEAMTLMHRSTRAKAGAVLLVDTDVFAQTKAVIHTRAEPIGIPVIEANLHDVASVEALREAAGGADVFGVIVQYPDGLGVLRDWSGLAQAAHEMGALVTAATDLLALTLITPPGEWGADIAVGSAQRFGVPMMFGGPHAGFMSVRKGLERTMPGRLVGVSVDAVGYPAYRLALQTREQHIRREKATSNICTAQVLLAVMASMYAVYHGPDGLRAIAARVHGHAETMAAALRRWRRSTCRVTSFRHPHRRGRASRCGPCRRRARARHQPVRRSTAARSGSASTRPPRRPMSTACSRPSAARVASRRTAAFRLISLRTSEFLTHPVFNAHHSETQMLRYLRSLADKDFALDRGMIPLGSCTMKLNATTEMAAGHLARVRRHPPLRADADQSQGYAALIAELEGWLCEITGYDAVSVQPNAGSQGESPACWPSVATTALAATITARSASSRRAHMAPTPRAPSWRG
jgi:glycine dehydrogenase